MPLGGIRLSTERGAWGFKASGSTVFDPKISSTNELEIQGIHFDTIVSTFNTPAEISDPTIPTADAWRFTDKEFVLISKLGHIAGSLLNWSKASCSDFDQGLGEAAMLSYATTINTGHWSAGDRALERRTQLSKFMICVIEVSKLHSLGTEDDLVPPFRAALDMVVQTVEHLDCNIPMSEAIRIARSAETVMAPRRIFVTSRGYIGLGPDIVSSGDVCCVASGAEVPYVLRPFGSQVHLLVGECYIDGLMDREALLDGREGDGAWQTFFLL